MNNIAELRALVAKATPFAATTLERELCEALPALLDRLEASERDAERMRAGLETLRAWDCLNPPRTDLLADLGWVARTIDAALAKVKT